MAPRRILITDAGTLIGSHNLHQTLLHDTSVRAVVGSIEDVQLLRQKYQTSAHSRLDFAVVSHEESSVPGAFEDALRDHSAPFDTVIHTVNLDPFKEADCLARFINLQTETLTDILRSITAVATAVRRVIIVTSLIPFARWLVDPQVTQNPSRSSSASHRAAEVDSEYVLATSQASSNIVYDSLRSWMGDTHALFDLVYVTAPSIYGPSVRPLENSTDLQGANRRIWNICSNDPSERMTSPPYGIDDFIDVRDLAFATVRAVFVAQAANKRFTLSAGTMPSAATIAGFLADGFPELKDRIRSDCSPPRHPSSDEPSLEFLDLHLATAVLGLAEYRKTEETLGDIAQQILDLHRRKNWKSITQS